MNKQDIKNILISLRTHQNEAQVNFLLGQIDMMSSEKISQYLTQIGNSENAIRNFLLTNLQKNNLQHHKHHQKDTRFTPINETFTYGITGNCVHLHFPKKSYELIKQRSISKTFDALHLHLLDAINQARILKENGAHQFRDVTGIYVISSHLSKATLKFLNDMNCQTTFYSEKDLKNEEFVKEYPEARFRN